MNTIYGLIGTSLKHSFSPNYFNNKFKELGIDASYHAFELDTIAALPKLIQQYPDLKGLNVTIPFKTEVISYLDKIDPAAERIGAVNCIKITGGKLTGYNTDWIGFKKTLEPLLNRVSDSPIKALVFGTGGASKAVKYALEVLNIPFQFVSRIESNALGYNDLTPSILEAHTLLINTTPIGMYPNTGDTLPIPRDGIKAFHVLYDLIYNPDISTFLQLGNVVNATTQNGLEMLHIQAEEGWKIWNTTI